MALAASIEREMLARDVGVREWRFVRPGGVGRAFSGLASDGEGVEGFILLGWVAARRWGFGEVQSWLQLLCRPVLKSYR